VGIILSLNTKNIYFVGNLSKNKITIDIAGEGILFNTFNSNYKKLIQKFPF